MMRTIVCESCGATNPADASFCQVCRAFVGWDRTSVIPEVSERAPSHHQEPERGRDEHHEHEERDRQDEQNVATRQIPKITPDMSLDTAGTPKLAVRPEQDHVIVSLTGERAEVGLVIGNRSDIVDGYEVDAGGAPDWLRIDSQPLRLLPGTEERLVLGFRIVSDALVAAGQGLVRLRIRSLNQAPAHEIVPITVAVPVVDPPVRLRTEPSVVRLQDVEVGRFVVVVDNSGANVPAEVRLSGSDPELAVAFHFDPAAITVGPGESARVRAVTTSARPRAGSELTRALSVVATQGKRRAETTVTLVQSTSVVVEEPMVELAVVPALVRLRDGGTATARVRLDNGGGRQWANVRLSASDPEQAVSVQWSQTEVRVPPGSSTEVELRVWSPTPDPGTEATYPVTITVTDGRRTARAQLTVVHTASPSPMTTLGVQLDPSVLRLGPRRRGVATVSIDNRGGRLPVRIRLHGDDPENVVGFSFTPPELSVGPGQLLSARVAVSTPRAAVGRETSRPFTVAAADGRTAATTTGTIIQTAADRRPWARVVLTLGGVLAMILGAMLPLRAASSRDAFDLDVNTIAGLFDTQVVLGGFEQLITFGAVILVLAGLLAFSLTGQRGRLSRLIGLITVVLVVALLITIGLAGFSATPGVGAVLIIVGGVLGYVGGLLARR